MALFISSKVDGIVKSEIDSPHVLSKTEILSHLGRNHNSSGIAAGGLKVFGRTILTEYRLTLSRGESIKCDLNGGGARSDRKKTTT